MILAYLSQQGIELIDRTIFSAITRDEVAAYSRRIVGLCTETGRVVQTIFHHACNSTFTPLHPFASGSLTILQASVVDINIGKQSYVNYWLADHC